MAVGLNLLEEFIIRFNNLKAAAKNSPERLRTFYRQSEAIRRACDELQGFLARTDLERRVFHGKRIQCAEIRGFEEAWREYDTRWRFRAVFRNPLDVLQLLDWDAEQQQVVKRSDRPWLGESLEAEAPAGERITEAPDPEEEECFDPRRHDGGAAIELGIEELDIHARFPVTDQPGRINSCRLALQAYDYLVNTIGLDIRGAFRRWQKLPIVFIPAHVSNHDARGEKGSLVHLLDDAVRAYVFGAPTAAVAICRAALEMVLKEHYGHGEWEDYKLGKLIILASQRYNFIQEKRIVPLVEKANRIVHDYSKSDHLSNEDDRTIVMFLKTVKFLIKRAPER
jgi:hypothetical protein